MSQSRDPRSSACTIAALRSEDETAERRTRLGRPEVVSSGEAETALAQASNTSAPADLAALPEVDPKAYIPGIEIGRGGMGRVLAARDRKLRRDVVIKVLRDGAYGARFARE